MTEKVKQHGVLILLVLVAAVLLVQMKILGDVQALQNQVQMQSMDSGSIRYAVNSEISGMQSRLEETLKQEASALSSFQWTQGEMDPDTLKASLLITASPKEVAGDTRVRVQLPDGETITLKREGVTFTGTVWMSLFDEGSLKVLLDRGGVTTVEEPAPYLGSLWEYYLPPLNGSLWYAAPKRGSEGTVAIQGNARVSLATAPEGGNAFQTLSLRCTIDGKELWNKPLTQEEEPSGDGGDWYYQVVEFQGVEKTPEQTLDLVLLATDRYGLVYHYRLPDNFLNAGNVNGSSADFLLAAVYKADGTLLYLA